MKLLLVLSFLSLMFVSVPVFAGDDDGVGELGQCPTGTCGDISQLDRGDGKDTSDVAVDDNGSAKSTQTTKK